MYPTKTILLQILQECHNRGVSIGKTQLVKYLYLAEVEYYRNTGQRLTDLQWLFYHYGPYALELENILREPEFETIQNTIEQGKTFIRFKVAEIDRSYLPTVEAKLSLLVKKIVTQWKDTPLNKLLDYVYFETEPMEAVKQLGDLLDFNTIEQENELQKVIPLKASKETETKVALLRERIKPFLQSMGETPIPEPINSEEYVAAIQAWNEEAQEPLLVPQNFRVTIKQPVDTSAEQGS